MPFLVGAGISGCRCFKRYNKNRNCRTDKRNHLCTQCHGDCDYDADCTGSLVCQHRHSYNSANSAQKGYQSRTLGISGCKSGGIGDHSTWDYCVDPALIWKKTVRRHCWPSRLRYGAARKLYKFAKVDDAMEQCIKMKKGCKYVYETNCNGKGNDVYLCSSAKTYGQNSKGKACLLTKPGNAKAPSDNTPVTWVGKKGHCVNARGQDVNQNQMKGPGPHEQGVYRTTMGPSRWNSRLA